MPVTQQEIRGAVRALGLAGRALCLHSSLRSFGHVVGGAAAVVRPFLDEGCTVLVPTFSAAFGVEPPPHLRFERNGWDEALTRAAAAIRDDPLLTHCGEPACARCRDAVAGGAVLGGC